MHLKLLVIAVIVLANASLCKAGDVIVQEWEFPVIARYQRSGKEYQIPLFRLEACSDSLNNPIALVCPTLNTQNRNFLTFAQDIYKELQQPPDVSDITHQQNIQTLYQRSTRRVFNYLSEQSIVNGLQHITEAKEYAPTAFHIALKQLDQKLQTQQVKIPLYAIISAITSELILEGQAYANPNKITPLPEGSLLDFIEVSLPTPTPEIVKTAN